MLAKDFVKGTEQFKNKLRLDDELEINMRAVPKLFSLAQKARYKQKK